MAERDERALREALEALSPDEPVDPVAARHRAAERRRNGRALAGIAVALVLVAGVVGLPRLLPASPPQAASGDHAGAEAGGGQAEPESDGRTVQESGPREASPSTDPAPEGWRTEYYHNITFQVPSSWGYAQSPITEWCTANPGGQLRPEQQAPFVWLGSTSDRLHADCDRPMPDSLFTEHVTVVPPSVRYQEITPPPGWFVASGYVGQERLVALSRDRDLAQQIVDSGRVDRKAAQCALPTQSNQMGARPPRATDLSTIGEVDEVRLCQYPSSAYSSGYHSNLRAVRVVSGTTATNLVATLRSAPVDDRPSCDPMPFGGDPEIFVLVRVVSAGKTHDIYVSAIGCPGSERGMVGGIDDGTTLRLLTRDACRQVLTPPIAIFTATGAVAENCLG